MTEKKIVRVKLAIALLITSAALSGCIGTIVEATTDAAIAVVKIPFKIGGAAVDMMQGEDPDVVGKHKRSRSRQESREERQDPGREDDEAGEEEKSESEAQHKT